MIYLVNCDKLRLFKTFDSLKSVVAFLKHINETKFDGSSFSLFGRGTHQVWNKEGEVEFVDDEYYIDSVVLCPKGKPTEYYAFFIRCIDSEGNSIELD